MLAILKNEFDDNHLHWMKACEHFGVQFEVVDIVSQQWLDILKSKAWLGFLVCPSGRQSHFKTLYDERLSILNELYSSKLFFPSLTEVKLHENKKYLSYWLAANEIPHPKTFVFYNQSEAQNFILNYRKKELVGKMNIGASGKGVVILRDKIDQMNYIKKAFSEGIGQSWGPNMAMGGWMHRIKKLIKDPSRIKKRLQIYNMNRLEIQKDFVIFQEYIEHKFEWRVVRIGDSFFAHQKTKQGDKASGTKGIEYIIPTDNLLNFVREVTDTYGFNCMAIDLFEDGMGGYLINEMQCIFGHVQSFICAKNDRPGRLLTENGGWFFQEGVFNENLSYDLRLETFLNFLQNEGAFRSER
jgi:glutathione synthase/RimK-type ligase-like ATP-grasp enzyme